jgi:pyruvate/2-oxoglutarate dehydrogenase complex dihydrolipoamide dehydrogenase (E3) component
MVTRDEFGGTAANDGPVPVRTLAHAARLIREAGQLGRYGIDVSKPVLDYRRLPDRVNEVTHEPRRGLPAGQLTPPKSSSCRSSC